MRVCHAPDASRLLKIGVDLKEMQPLSNVRGSESTSEPGPGGTPL